ncbi:TIGR02265 family protein [Pyxidicoccus sp. 3LG]
MGQDATTGAPGAADLARELEQRLALATPDKTRRGMFLKGILQVVGSLGDEASVRRCQEASGQTRITDFHSYPIASHLRMLFTAAEVLAPRSGGYEGAFRLLGRQSVTDFMGSLAGRTMLALTNRDIVKMLNSLPRAYEASVNYGQRSVEWSGPKRGRFLLEGDLLPAAFNAGVVEAVLLAGEAKSMSVEARQLGPAGCECVFSWE